MGNEPCRLYLISPPSLDPAAFADTLAVPKLVVTSHQEIRYRFVVFNDMIMYDKIEGLSGRALTGFFRVFGDVSAKHSRYSLSTDGMMVVRARAKKIISTTRTLTIQPDGRVEKGTPSGRDDLAEIESRLKQKVEFDDYPHRCW